MKNESDSISLDIDKFQHLCRICLTENDEMSNIFSSSIENTLKECISIQVNPKDGLPQKICLQCLDTAKIAHDFKKLSEKSDKILRDSLKKSGVEIIFLEWDDSDDKKGQTTDNKDIKLQLENEHCSAREDEEHEEDIEVLLEKENGKIVVETEVKCELCNANVRDINFGCKDALDAHNSKFHQIETSQHKCFICMKSFEDLAKLRRHIRFHKATKNHICPTCNKGFLGSLDLKIHRRTHTSEKPEICQICSKPFSDPRALIRHVKTHMDDEKGFLCSICNKGFNCKSALTIHKRTHTSERPYICSICGKSFMYSHNLVIHTRSHTGDRPYKCQVCSKTFTSSSTALAHNLTHTKAKRFTCEECGKTCARSGDLTIHKRVHTREKPYCCSLCPKTYKMSSHLKTHIQSHSPGN